MAARTLIRPTGFVDSPFGHDGKVARLAGGLNWFAAVEVIEWDGSRRVSTELVSVERLYETIDDMPPDAQVAWERLTAARQPLAAWGAHDPPRPAAGHGHPQRHARQLLGRGAVR